jgi:hypothetical protein
MIRRGLALGALSIFCCFALSCAKPLPVIVIDALPNANALRGATPVTGAAAQRSGIRSVTLYVDTKRSVTASVDTSNSDAARAYPQIHAPNVSRWRAVLDASRIPVGVHYVTALARANDGTFTQATITVFVGKQTAQSP